MKKRTAIISLFLCLLFSIDVSAAMPQQVVAVGKAVGIDVQCSGLMVVGFAEDSPARDGGLHQGDIIIKVDGQLVDAPAQLRALLQDKSQVTLTALRRQQEQSFLVRPQLQDGQALIGANVRSEMAGIGTITYYDPATAVFGALGHGITEGSSSKLFPVHQGFLCSATVARVDKGEAGSPGMLQGAFDSNHILGLITKNTPCGIFGQLTIVPQGETVVVGARDQVHTGLAEILCNVEGEQVAHYTVKITRLFPLDDNTGRNLMLEVTDPALLQRTGGIVQGMSGSPILQDGKLIGAVTHVLVSDPTTGYGIFIDNMLKAAA